ncbi:hypothetical protein D3C84_1049380 [compost metagenome]
MAGAQRRMPGEGQFVQGGKDPHAVVGPRIARFQHERGFTEVGPGRERGHTFVTEFVRAEHHRQWIALEGDATENIYLFEIE